MLGSLIVILLAGASGYFSTKAWGWGWGITCGLLVLVIGWIVFSMILRFLTNGRQMLIQNIMTDAQNKINRQMEMYSRRPPSSNNAARQVLEKIQVEAVRKALAETDGFKKFYIWNMMLAKQVNAMKVQFYYQLREYSNVDELLPKALLFDPNTIGIKMARMYKKNDPGIDKFYKSKCWRFKGENGAFLASVYAWIKVKQENPQAALEALHNARKTSDNQIVLENIERLTNGKVKHYSNSGFGEPWYALALEEPKVKNQRQHGRPF